jgi:hypothetical protein
MKRLHKRYFHTPMVLAFVAVAALVPLYGQATRPAPTSPPAAAATTRAAAMTEDIRDIRGPKAIPSPEIWFLWLAGGAVLAALAYGSWRWYRHARSAPKLPHEIALARLEKARALMTTETAREFSIAVSEIVRSYIEARFRVRAVRQTTEEFLRNLLEPSDALLVDHRELLGDFLHHCDLAKFARWILSLDEMEGMYGSAHAFISETGKASVAAKPATPAIITQTSVNA